MAIEEGSWFWYQVTEALDGQLVGNPVREIYTVTSVRGKAVEVKKEVPGIQEPETLHTLTSYGSYIFDISKLALMKEEKIMSCIGPVTCEVCSKVTKDESETVYIDRKDIVYRHVRVIKRADGKTRVIAKELVAIGL
ncbi:MAG: hypothetical protein MJZ38_06105 [archaeon]|nr:hypothetical protein [archaeon]